MPSLSRSGSPLQPSPLPVPMGSRPPGSPPNDAGPKVPRADAKYEGQAKRAGEEVERLKKNQREDLRPAEKPLAGYMMAAAAAGKHIDNPKTVRALRDGVDTMQETTKAIPKRGNILSDLVETGGQSMIMMDAGREIGDEASGAVKKFTEQVEAGPINRGQFSKADIEHLKKCYPQDIIKHLTTEKKLSPDEAYDYYERIIRVAVARFVKAGNCGELTDDIAARHSTKLDPSQRMHTVHSKTIDHEWASIAMDRKVPHHGDNVVLDPWLQNYNYMTPVTHAHGRFSGMPLRIAQTVDMRTAPFIEPGIALVEKGLEKNSRAKEIIRDYQESGPEYVGPRLREHQNHLEKNDSVGASHKGVYAKPPHILRDKFRDAAREGLSKLDGDSPLSSQPSAPPPLRREILATGVARNLGFPIRQAAGVVSDNSAFMGDAKRVISDIPIAGDIPGSPAN